MRFFYNLFITFYPLFIRVASIWNPKAALWVNGRKNQFSRLQQAVDSSTKPIIWFHSASLGEFEQGRPVIERIRSTYPSYRILLTFFSPSGYEVRKNYSGADIVFYLPMDSKRNARLFIEITQPKTAIFIKYETWYHYLKTLSENQIPAFLISAVLYQNQFSFSPWANFMKTTLSSFSHIFTQSDDALELLKEHEVATDYSLGGDTRYDRVKELSEIDFQNKDIELFINNMPVVVAGSTWRDDEQKLQALHVVHQNVKLIIAPHEISNKNITELQELFPNSILFSTIQNIKNPEAYSILIIDCIGLLSKLYRYATIAYVGGGFNRAGIHNILEAAAYGKKVIFGPNYSKSNEAKEMIALSLAHSFSSQEELLNSVDELQSDSQKLEEINKLSKEFVEERTGATEKILQLIERDQVL